MAEAVDLQEARRLRDEGALVLDVRDTGELATGMVPGARWYPVTSLREINSATELPPFIYDADEILIYCESGKRSLEAAEKINAWRETPSVSLSGGIAAWKKDGGEVVGQVVAERYARQVILPELGVAGQKKLSEAKVLCLGAGGLGSPVLFYLAAAGVGEIGILDADVVDATNLHRQILHTTSAIGEPKTESAIRTLSALNPEIKLKGIRERYDLENMDIVADYDFVVDGVDNLRTRYILNSACVRHGKAMVYASIIGFAGQLSVFNYENGPCYRCAFPWPPPAELVPACSVAGVLGAIPGVLGSLEATEALKIITDIGDVMGDRILLYDALDQEFQKVKTHKDPNCPACSHPGEEDQDSLLAILAAC